MITLVLISGSSVNVFAEEWTQEQLETGRYSEADPNGPGVGEGASSDDKEKHEHYYSYDPNSKSFTTSSVEAALANGCDCVVFRLDDLQDFWLPDVQVTVMDQFVQRNQYLSVGPIVSIFGGDPTVVDFAVDGFNSGLFEVFVHGWTHVDHTGLDLATQTSTLQSSQDKLTLIFGSPVLVFIPPYNAFNADTLTALDSGGYEIISAAEYTDSYPYFVADGSSNITDSLGLYHLPESIGFVQYGGGGPIRIPPDQVLAAIDSSVASKGYAVVTIHSQEFAEKQGGVEINSIDQNYIDDLNEVLDGILARNYPIKTFKQIVDYNQSQGPDTEKPVITPLGFSDTILVNTVYTELGAYVTDNDPAYSESVIIGGDTVDTSTPGDYTITYNAPADAAGNVPFEQSITITVEPDYENPVIYPNGFSTSIPFGSTYTEQGAWVTDNDPAYSESVIIGGDTVDPYTSGDYTITYNAPADAAGNVP
ncbi:MAG: immunoglobulin-like domain-containing protein, partial [Nitrosopumilaceae archaeon]